MKKVAILQSNYIPWKGYFDIIGSVDEFIFYDDMQYTKRDWRNRNKIKTPQGTSWLTIPVKVKGRFYQSIRDTEVDGISWQELHWKTITSNYRKAPYFDEISTLLKPLYKEYHYTHLSPLNQTFIRTICCYLQIKTNFLNSWDFDLRGEKSERLANICHQTNADVYVTGPSAKEYLQEDIFNTQGVSVKWINYSDYPMYKQLWNGFIHEVSILDLLFNCGHMSSNFMKFMKD